MLRLLIALVMIGFYSIFFEILYVVLHFCVVEFKSLFIRNEINHNVVIKRLLNSVFGYQMQVLSVSTFR